MGPLQDPPAMLETLVDHMFDQVLEADARAGLLVWIREWEAANPDVDNAHRITGWIDVAYAFQARNLVTGDARRSFRVTERVLPRLLAFQTSA